MDPQLKNSLDSVMRAGKVPSAFLLTAEADCDLEVNAKEMAKMLTKCGDISRCPSFLSLHPQGKMRQIAVDRVREIIRAIQLRATGDGFQVIAIFDSDRLHRHAANALLKSIEEPPGGTIFILTARNPYAVMATIRSRCQIHRISGHSVANGTVAGDERWTHWLEEWRWLVEETGMTPSKRLIVDAYVLIDNFLSLLDEEEKFAHSLDETDGFGKRQLICRGRLRECARVLFDACIGNLPSDGDERRIAIHRLSGRLHALDRAASLLAVNCSESAAIESIVLALF
jgi:hypothetical protein